MPLRRIRTERVAEYCPQAIPKRIPLDLGWNGIGTWRFNHDLYTVVQDEDILYLNLARTGEVAASARR
jgi:hypothetical protein